MCHLTRFLQGTLKWLTAWFWVRVFCAVAAKVIAEADGLTEAGGWAAHVPVKLVPPGRRPSFLLGHMGLSIELFECPHNI